MTNKFRGIEPVPAGEDTERPVQMGMDGGFRGDVSPREVPPNSTPELIDVRFERRGIRKDFGWTAIGTAAAAVVRGIIEHKYIDSFLQFHRLVRVFLNGTGNAVVQVWDGDQWLTVDTSTEVLLSVYLSMVSAQGCVYIADGRHVLEWCEVLQKTLRENDFPAFNGIGFVGGQVNATVTPASPSALEYQINYDVEITGNAGGATEDTVATLEFLHGTVSLGERQYTADVLQGLVKFQNEFFRFTRQINDLDVVSIKLKNVQGGPNQAVSDNIETPGGGGEPNRVGNKTSTQPDRNNQYAFSVNIVGLVASTTVQVFVDKGAGFVLVGTITTNFLAGEGFGFGTFTITGLSGGGMRWGVTPAAGTVNTASVGYNVYLFNMSVHGHNKAVQGDSPAGVTYETVGAAISQLQRIDPGPGGRFLVHFARRLVVFRNLGDSQIVSWSRDGILNDFSGTGSGEVALVETRSDAIDDLMGGAVLNSNFLAVFRRRSIWRGFETGNVQLAIGIVSWIENLGTGSPFSIRNVRGGVIFLGHDLMVYFLTEQGAVAIGEPIHQELIETLRSLDKVDSGYDPVFQDYLLGIPDATGVIDTVWAFNVKRFLDKQEIVWRKKAMIVQRFSFGAASVVEGTGGIVGTPALAKTADGRLARFRDDPLEPFVVGDWTYLGNGGSLTIGALNNPLQIPHGGGASDWQGALLTAIPNRDRGFAQALMDIVNIGALNTSIGVGLIGTNGGTRPSMYVKAKAHGPSVVAGQRVTFVGRAINGAPSGAVVGPDNTNANGQIRQTIFVNAQPATEANRVLEGWDNVDNVTLNGQPTVDMTLINGTAFVGRFEGPDGLCRVYEFYYATDKFISVTGGLLDGWKVQLRNVGEAVLTEVTVTGGGGTALIDLITDRVWMDDIRHVVIVSAANNEIVRTTPPGGVWGGDTYTFSVS